MDTHTHTLKAQEVIKLEWMTDALAFNVSVD